MKQLRITADKREIKDFPKLPFFDFAQYRSATSFIRKTLYEMGVSK